MLKKLLLVFVALFAVAGLAACDPTEATTEEPVERTYKADGVYTAFSNETTNAGGPQMTWVSVTIENDEITEIFIDCIQSAAVKDAEEVTTGFAFNASSKKELGYAYRMHGQRSLSEADYIQWLRDNDKLEWFEQAELIEAFMLENGPAAVTKDAQTFIDNIASVSIKDGNYTVLAAQAIQNAIDGVTYVVTTSGMDIVWVKAEVNEEGVFTSLELNTLQGRFAEGAFFWRDQNKQELGYAYRMHRQNALSEADYIEWLRDNDKLEWHEQAAVITDYVLENGVAGLAMDAANKPTTDGLSTVTIVVHKYFAVIQELYANFS